MIAILLQKQKLCFFWTQFFFVIFKKKREKKTLKKIQSNVQFSFAIFMLLFCFMFFFRGREREDRRTNLILIDFIFSKPLFDYKFELIDKNLKIPYVHYNI